MASTLRVGTVKGRHELPVDLYIAEDNYVKIPQVEYDRLYNATEAIIEKLRGKFIEVYYAGFTPHVIGVIDALDYYGIPFVLKAWDFKSNRYYDLRRTKR